MKILYSLLLIVIFQESIAQGTAPLNNGSNLPIIVINTNGGTIIEATKINTSFKIIYNTNAATNYLTSTNFHYNGIAGVEIRGSSSATDPKKSYSIEFRNTQYDGIDFAPFGLPLESDWVLTANYKDRTYLKNAYMYHLWGKTGKYSPRLRFVEVVINGDYQGLYAFTEKIKHGNNRVDISDLYPTDTDPSETSATSITGGYLIEGSRENSDFIASYPSWQSAYPSSKIGAGDKMAFDCKYPKDPVVAQFNYIKSYMDNFEAALKGANFSNPTSGFRKYIDEQSFVDNFVLQEYSIHLDIFSRSQYFYKDKGQKLVASPLWDTSAGLTNWETYTNDWRFSCAGCDARFFWAERLMEDCQFKNKVIDTYKDFRRTFLTQAKITSYIDSIVTIISPAAARDITKWPYSGVATFAGEITKLKTFTQNRLTWVDNNIHNIKGATGKTLTSTASGVSIIGQNVILITNCPTSSPVLWRFDNIDGTYGSFVIPSSSVPVAITRTVTYTASCQTTCPQFTNPITITVSNNCPINLTFPTTITHSFYPTIQKYSVTQYITSAAKTSAAAKTTYTAGRAIELRPGFLAGRGTVFSARIQACQ